MPLKMRLSALLSWIPQQQLLLLSGLLASAHVAAHEFNHQQAQFALEQPINYAAVNSSSLNCDQATIGPQSVYHGTAPQGFYETYYSTQQAELRPTCVFMPETAQQVAEAVVIVKNQKCPFAVKSGGHTPCIGGSNIQDGLVFDLRNLNGFGLSEDKSIASIGSGSKWIDVYKALEEHKLAVLGGRVGTVGTGGFLLGGGLSLYSQKYGWASDNVKNFEIVLSDGTIAQANLNTHPDLYWALRGGGNNFGVVTRFDIETHPSDLIWGGTDVIALSDIFSREQALSLKQPSFDWTLNSMSYKLGTLFHQVLCLLGKCAHSKDVINVFVKMAEQPDTNAHMYIFFAWYTQLRMMGSGGSYAYLEPVDKPAAFANLTALASFYSTKKLRTVTNLVEEITGNTLTGVRTYWDTITFKVDADFLSKAWDIFMEETHHLKYIPNCQPSINNQLITKNHIARSNRNGGSPMGIKEEDGPLALYSIVITWSDPKDDDRMQTAGKKVITRVKALAQEMGLDHPFTYKNYADGATDVYAGYGTVNRQEMREIQKKYDPEGVFSRLQSRGHRI